MRIINTTAIIIIAFLIFVVFPLYRGAYASSDLAGMWYSAFIGSIITYFLLTMQSKGEVERERQAEVFKERLDIYQEFLKKLYDVVEDREVEDKEFLNLQFQLSYLAMHTDRERMEIIQEKTFEILKTVCVPMPIEQNGQRGKKEDPVFMNHLYEIVRQMQAQLYEKNEMKPLDKGISTWEKWKENSQAAFEKCLLNSGITLAKKEISDQSIKHTVDDETLKRISSIFLSSKKNDLSADHNTPNEPDEKEAAETWKNLLEEKYHEWEFLFEDKNNKSQGFQIIKPYGHV